jgi:hypothetical protein
MQHQKYCQHKNYIFLVSILVVAVILLVIIAEFKLQMQLFVFQN